MPLDSSGITINPIKDMTTNRHFCEVFYENVRVPAANIVGEEGGSWKQTMRQLEHERGGIDRLLSNFVLYQLARRDADTSDPIIRQKIATLESGYKIGRLLVLREVMGRRRSRSRRRRRRSAPSTSSESRTSSRKSQAPTRWCGDGSRKGSATPPRTRSWAAPRTCCATSSANGCWGFPGNPEHPPRRVRRGRIARGDHRQVDRGRRLGRDQHGFIVSSATSGTRSASRPTRSSRSSTAAIA